MGRGRSGLIRRLGKVGEGVYCRYEVLDWGRGESSQYGGGVRAAVY
jgi:hypothetical protein